MKNDVVISTGYNGSPRGFENCCDIGKCMRMENDMHQGEGADNYISLPAKELQWVLDTYSTNS